MPGVACTNLTAIGKPPAPKGGLGLYDILVEFSTYQLLVPPKPRVGGPVVWSVKRNRQSVPIDHTPDGTVLQNSSGEPEDPPFTALLSNETLHGEWYEKGPDQPTIYAKYRKYSDCVNKVPYAGMEVGCAKTNGVEVGQPVNGWAFCSVDFEYKKPYQLPGTNSPSLIEGWQYARIDKGRRTVQIDKVTGKDIYAAIMEYPVNADGTPDKTSNGGKPSLRVSEPRLLDGKGGLLADGDPPFINVDSPYSYIDFNQMGLQNIGK